MFNSSNSSSPSTWLLGLLLLWAVLLFGGFLFGHPDARHSRRMPTWTRIGSSAVLVVSAWSWFVVARESPIREFACLIAAGMTSGLIGDLFLANVFPASQPVVGGMGAFGLGHLCYIAAGLTLRSEYSLQADTQTAVAWATLLLIAAMSWYYLVIRGHRISLPRLLALPYAVLVASTAGVAIGLALQAPQLFSFALGASLFLVSDMIVAANRFGGLQFNLIHDVIWLTYGPGQMLIVYSVWGALRLAGQ